MRLRLSRRVALVPRSTLSRSSGRPRPTSPSRAPVPASALLAVAIVTTWSSEPDRDDGLPDPFALCCQGMRTSRSYVLAPAWGRPLTAASCLAFGCRRSDRIGGPAMTTTATAGKTEELLPAAHGVRRDAHRLRRVDTVPGRPAPLSPRQRHGTGGHLGADTPPRALGRNRTCGPRFRKMRFTAVGVTRYASGVWTFHRNRTHSRQVDGENPLVRVPSAGIEPAARGLGNRCSLH